MGQNSIISPLEAQIRECYGRVIYTHKTQEKCSDILNKRNRILKVVQIIFSSLTACGVIAIIFGNSIGFDIATAIISFITLGINLYLKEFDLGAIAQKHADAAVEVWDIREKYLSLLTDMNSGLSDDAVKVMRDVLQERLKNIYKGAPRTNCKAYQAARDGIINNEEMYFSNEELNGLLPESLRK